jgi:hypothetical protein
MGKTQSKIKSITILEFLKEINSNNNNIIHKQQYGYISLKYDCISEKNDKFVHLTI